jgi:tetratricopeptide (TPR) repeat protein
MIRVAQQASANRLVMGSYAGPAENLVFTARVLDLGSMKLASEIRLSSGLAGLAQMENELAWRLISDGGLNQIFSREQYKERSRRIPNSAYSYYIRSLNAEEEEEISLLEKAIGVHKDFPEAQFRLGSHYFRRGDHLKAINYLEAARGSPKVHLEAQFMLGACYLYRSSFPEAIKAYSGILSLRRSVEVMNNLAVAHLRGGDVAEALRYLLDARKLSRTDPVVALNLAIVRHIQGNSEAARFVLDELLGYSPNSAMVHYLLSLVCAAQGDFYKAGAALERSKALGANPDKLNSEPPAKWTRLISSWRDAAK